MHENNYISEQFNIPQIKLTFINTIPFKKRVKIQSAKDAYPVFYALWDKETIELFEEVKVLYVNSANDVLGYYNVNVGASIETIVDVNRIIAGALLCSAQGIILAHSHPSNTNVASNADIKITDRLIDACKVFKIMLLDHLIICPEEGKYHSIMYPDDK